MDPNTNTRAVVHVATTAMALQPQQPRQMIFYSQEQRRLIREHVAPDVTEMEFELFMAIAERRGLDPLAKKIYAVARSVWDPITRQRVKKMVIMVGIDGYRSIAARSRGRLYAGTDDIEYGPMADDPLLQTPSKRRPEWAKCTVWMIVSGRRVPYTRTVYWEERAQYAKDDKGNTKGYQGNWPTQPRTMIGKCAEVATLRIAAPEEMSGFAFDGESLSDDYTLPTLDQGEYLEGTAREITELDAARHDDMDDDLPDDAAELFALEAAPESQEDEAETFPADEEAVPDPITKQQLAALRLVRTRLGWTQAGVQEYVRQAFGGAQVQTLTESQAASLLAWLTAEADTRATAAEAAF